MKFNSPYSALGCLGKQRFNSREEAADRIGYRRRKEVRPYHCAVCNYWHNGSTENHRRKLLMLKELKRKKLEKAEVYDDRNDD